jgi:hypothetical protein
MPEYGNQETFIKNVKFLLGVRGLKYTTTLRNPFPRQINSGQVRV